MDHPQQTALAMPARALDPLVDRWRVRYDPSARAGMPAHVTLLVPFLPPAGIHDGLLRELEGLLAAFPPFDVTFPGTARFPGTVYLAPEPDAPFREITRALVARWPECPPYGGEHPDPTPHLTLADGEPEETLARVAGQARAILPARGRFAEVVLFVGSNRTGWEERATFRL